MTKFVRILMLFWSDPGSLILQSCTVPDQSASPSAKKRKPSNLIAETDISSVIGQLPLPLTGTDDLDDICH